MHWSNVKHKKSLSKNKMTFHFCSENKQAMCEPHHQLSTLFLFCSSCSFFFFVLSCPVLSCLDLCCVFGVLSCLVFFFHVLSCVEFLSCVCVEFFKIVVPCVVLCFELFLSCIFIDLSVSFFVTIFRHMSRLSEFHLVSVWLFLWCLVLRCLAFPLLVCLFCQ